MYFKHLFTLSALVLAACSSDDSDGDSNNNTERSANATPTVTVNNGIGKEKDDAYWMALIRQVLVAGFLRKEIEIFFARVPMMRR